ncbi:ABC transporter ATP-binding protein [Periweissella cryptocerci]|uniref:ATP-binding cassette domain-containing protein n=1 Tax=Periweissella cryptocerci TaxID=2506420 RepID=UPI00242D6203|nr:ABC transporter ATP-binding protein [Periweissella cryptocerci]
MARALVFDKSIILADEITAGLDEYSAQQVRTALYSLLTTIIEKAHHIEHVNLQELEVYKFTDEGVLLRDH